MFFVSFETFDDSKSNIPTDLTIYNIIQHTYNIVTALISLDVGSSKE